MNTDPDTLREPLRLLRESKLDAGFELRLAERLAQVDRQRTAAVLRFPRRRRAWLLLAAIAVPAAAAAAAGGYYALSHSEAKVPTPLPSSKPVGTMPLGPLPREEVTASFASTPSAPLSPPTVDQPTQGRSLGSSHTAGLVPMQDRRNDSPSQAVTAAPPPAAEGAPRIEELDPFASRAAKSSSSSASATSAGESERLRRATEQGAVHVDGDGPVHARGEAASRQERGNDAAQQMRERSKARERKGR